MSSTGKKGYYCPQCNGPVDAEDSICLGCNAERRGAWPVDPYVGRTIGRKYRIDRRVASSASGVVFGATQVHQDTELGSVIIKMLPKQVVRDQKLAARFMNEAKAARTLTNPHVVRVFDLDFDAGHIPYLVQEYVEGDPLDDIIMQAGKLSAARALTIALQIAEGMEEAHQKRILHRNLQPTNVIVRVKQHEDFIKIIGFGLYQPTGQTGAQRTVGAERYLAPEQREGAEASERTDIFALGLIFHEMLIGSLPEPDGPAPAELLPDGDTNLLDLLDMMLEPDPADRPPNMGRVVRLLEQAAEELGLNLDITGRFTVPPEAAKKKEEPPPLPPELPSQPPERSHGPKRLHPGLIVLAALSALILIVAIVMGAIHVCSRPVPDEHPPPADQAGEEDTGEVQEPPTQEKPRPEPVEGPGPEPDEGIEEKAAAPPGKEPPAEQEPATEEEPAQKEPPPVKKPSPEPVEGKPVPIKKKPLPGKKKSTPWTKI